MKITSPPMAKAPGPGEWMAATRKRARETASHDGAALFSAASVEADVDEGRQVILHCHLYSLQGNLGVLHNYKRVW